MGFLIIDSSLPLYKVLINVKRMNNAHVFLFKSFFRLIKITALLKIGTRDLLWTTSDLGLGRSRSIQIH